MPYDIYGDWISERTQMNNTEVPNPKLHKWATAEKFKFDEDLATTMLASTAVSAVIGLIIAPVTDGLWVDGSGFSGEGASDGPGASGWHYFWSIMIPTLLPNLYLAWSGIYQPLRHPPLKFRWPTQAEAYNDYRKLNEFNQNDIQPIYSLVMKLDDDTPVAMVEDATKVWREAVYELKQERQLTFFAKNKDAHQEAREQLDKLKERVTMFKAIEAKKDDN